MIVYKVSKHERSIVRSSLENFCYTIMIQGQLAGGNSFTVAVSVLFVPCSPSLSSPLLLVCNVPFL